MLKTIATLLLILARGWAQQNASCVQVVDSTAADTSPYANTEPSLTFTMEGVTGVQGNTEFAKNTVATFADRNIFENGGSASYVQFSSYTTDEGTFYSTESFDAHVDAVEQFGSGTDIVSGILAGKELLDSTPSSYDFMILITDGEHNGSGDVAATSEEAREDNTTTIFAVGVGVSPESLVEIAGDESNVFNVNNFTEISAALADIEVVADMTVVRCLASDVSISIEFNAGVSSVGSPGAAITGENRATFTADDLEENPTQFMVGLKTCGDILLVEYDDEQGNVPDFSNLREPTCPQASGGKAAALLASVCVVSAIILVLLASMFGGSKSSSTTIYDEPAGDGQLPPSNNVDNAGNTSEKSAVREAAVIADNLHHGSPNEDIGTVQELAGGRGKRAAPIAGGKNLPGTSSSTAEASYAADSSSVPSRAPPADVVNAGAASGDGAGRSGAGASGGGAGADRQVVLFPIIPSLRSARNPSSTLAWLLIVQVQFLAVLSLVDSAGSGHSWLADFLRHLRWMNLWVVIRPDSEDEYPESEEDNDIGEEEFVGNIVLSLCIGFLILVHHLVVVSAIEACWLQKMKQRRINLDARAGFGEDGQPPSYEEMTRSSREPVAATAAAIDEEAVTKCRDRSKSIWIHFPHVEISYLLFAVQGALAAQLAVLRSDDGVIISVAVIALVLYPLFLLGVMFRIILARVLPHAGGIDFTLTEKDGFFSASGRRSCQSFFSRALKGLKEEHSAFAWAKKGVWRTADARDDGERRLLDWFHIGFQPFFADYTQSGSWFALYALLESYLTACVGVLLDSNSELQLLIFMVLHALGCVLVLWRNPYANRVINFVDACRRGMNAICMALLVVAEAGDGRVHEKHIETAVVVIELLLLWALAVPIYVDNGMVLVGAICRRIKKVAIFCGCCGARNDPAESAGPAERNGVSGRCVPQDWPATWYQMIGRNIAAYAADVANGLRRKPHSA